MGTSTIFYPSGGDVLAVQQTFLSLEMLPIEIIDYILESAHYFPCIHVERCVEIVALAKMHPHVNMSYPESQICYLLTPQIPAYARLVIEIVFTTDSHDQGWGGCPENRGKLTWILLIYS